MSNKQRLVLSVIDFLNQSIDDGTVKQDDKESLEVASASSRRPTSLPPPPSYPARSPLALCPVQSNVSVKRSVSIRPTASKSTASP